MNFKFIGREGYYREGVLYLLGQRWYDSEVGRFISRDPIFNLNLYIYALNSPINYVDPFGSQPSGAIPRFEDIPTENGYAQTAPGIYVNSQILTFFSQISIPGIEKFLSPKIFWQFLRKVNNYATALFCAGCAGCIGGTAIGCLGAPDWFQCFKDVLRSYWEDLNCLRQEKGEPNWRRIHGAACVGLCGACGVNLGYRPYHPSL